MRVVGFIVMAGVIGVATGLLLHRVLVGVLVGAALLILGIFVLISGAASAKSEP
jgi:hypothetical protein